MCQSLVSLLFGLFLSMNMTSLSLLRPGLLHGRAYIRALLAPGGLVQLRLDAPRWPALSAQPCRRWCHVCLDMMQPASTSGWLASEEDPKLES